MKRVAAVLIGWLFVVPSVFALSGALVLNQPQPIHVGDTISFSVNLTGAKGGSSVIWVICEQPDFDSANIVYNVRKPIGSSFYLDSPTWNHAQQATCDSSIVYTTTFGRDRVRNTYLGEQTMVVLP
jgi:hypothetical protein